MLVRDKWATRAVVRSAVREALDIVAAWQYSLACFVTVERAGIRRLQDDFLSPEPSR